MIGAEMDMMNMEITDAEINTEIKMDVEMTKMDKNNSINFFSDWQSFSEPPNRHDIVRRSIVCRVHCL